MKGEKTNQSSVAAVHTLSTCFLSLANQAVLTRSEPAGSPYVPSCSLQPDSGRFFDGRIPVCSGAFQPVPTGKSSEFVRRKTGRNPVARNMTKHMGNRLVPVGAGKDPTVSCDRNDRPGHISSSFRRADLKDYRFLYIDVHGNICMYFNMSYQQESLWDRSHWSTYSFIH